jgi:hypothetical protein
MEHKINWTQIFLVLAIGICLETLLFMGLIIFKL